MVHISFLSKVCIFVFGVWFLLSACDGTEPTPGIETEYQGTGSFSFTYVFKVCVLSFLLIFVTCISYQNDLRRKLDYYF